MKKTTAIMLILAAALVCHADTKTTWRDAQGRVQGTMTTDRYGTTMARLLIAMRKAVCRAR